MHCILLAASYPVIINKCHIIVHNHRDMPQFERQQVTLITYMLETVALTKRQEAEMEVAELKMLRFSLIAGTRIDNIRNEYIRGTAQVGRFGEKTRGGKTEVV